MSLIVHPAPLIITAPNAIRLSKYGSGNCPGDVAIPRLQLQGQNRSHDPTGLSNLTRRKNGWTVFGDFSTILAVEHHEGVVEGSDVLELLLMHFDP